jgi:hypothetical protein
VADQVFTLVGVVVGAGTSFVVSGLGERIRYRREIKIRWDTHKLDAYVRYVVSVVQMARIAGQIAGQRGWDELAAPIDEQKAPRALDDAELERTAAFERLVMLAIRRVSQSLMISIAGSGRWSGSFAGCRSAHRQNGRQSVIAMWPHSMHSTNRHERACRCQVRS